MSLLFVTTQIFLGSFFRVSVFSFLIWVWLLSSNLLSHVSFYCILYFSYLKMKIPARGSLVKLNDLLLLIDVKQFLVLLLWTGSQRSCKSSHGKIVLFWIYWNLYFFSEKQISAVNNHWISNNNYMSYSSSIFWKSKKSSKILHQYWFREQKFASLFIFCFLLFCFFSLEKMSLLFNSAKIWRIDQKRILLSHPLNFEWDKVLLLIHWTLQ